MNGLSFMLKGSVQVCVIVTYVTHTDIECGQGT
jgi:hypothetical protein